MKVEPKNCLFFSLGGLLGSIMSILSLLAAGVNTSIHTAAIGIVVISFLGTSLFVLIILPAYEQTKSTESLNSDPKENVGG